MKSTAWFLVLAMSILACGSPAALPTLTALPSITATASRTPRPTATLIPTLTPIPTATPAPILFKGSGDDVLEIAKWEGPALLKSIYNGGGNFAVWNDDANGDHIDLLINTIGHYSGVVPLDFAASEHTSRLEIGADGPWEISILPFEMIRQEFIPGSFSGNGDDVIEIQGNGSPDLLKIDASKADGNFIIWAYSDFRDLLVNEIAPYTGTVAMDQKTIVIAVGAEGPWSIEITVK